MTLVEKTELNKYYLAYWATEYVKMVIIFKQVKEPKDMMQRQDDEHCIYYKINCWGSDGSWVEEYSEEPEYGSLNIRSHWNISNDGCIYELNDDDINHHIVTQII